MLLKYPILSEKTAASLSNGEYVFAVDPKSTKPALKQELKQLFKVEAVSVRIVNLKAKGVKFRGHRGAQRARHKAYIRLKPKQIIPGFEEQKEAKSKSDAKTS